MGPYHGINGRIDVENQRRIAGSRRRYLVLHGLVFVECLEWYSRWLRQLPSGFVLC